MRVMSAVTSALSSVPPPKRKPYSVIATCLSGAAARSSWTVLRARSASTHARVVVDGEVVRVQDEEVEGVARVGKSRAFQASPRHGRVDVADGVHGARGVVVLRGRGGADEQRRRRGAHQLAP